MYAVIPDQFRVERDGRNVLAPDEHRVAVEFGDYLNTIPEPLDPRSADEEGPDRGLTDLLEVEVGLERADLPAVGVALDVDVEQPEMGCREDDHAGARPEDRVPIGSEPPDRLGETLPLDPHRDRGRFSAGDHEPGDRLEIRGSPDLDRLNSSRPQQVEMECEVPLEREDADDAHVSYQPRCERSSPSASFELSIDVIA